MVPRRHSQPRTVKTDSGFSGEFENFFDALTGIFGRPTEASQAADSDKFGLFRAAAGRFYRPALASPCRPGSCIASIFTGRVQRPAIPHSKS
jgi:hypothetical protein